MNEDIIMEASSEMKSENSIVRRLWNVKKDMRTVSTD